MNKNFVNLKNARKGEYKKVISEIVSTGKCPFCKENFKYHKEPILKEKNGWILTKNSWPYKNTSYHFIIISKEHKENILELTKKDMESVLFLSSFAINKYNIEGGALTIRFGKTKYTGASVSHLHFHLISPEIDKKTKEAKKTNFSIG